MVVCLKFVFQNNIFQWFRILWNLLFPSKTIDCFFGMFRIFCFLRNPSLFFFHKISWNLQNIRKTSFFFGDEILESSESSISFHCKFSEMFEIFELFYFWTFQNFLIFSLRTRKSFVMTIISSNTSNFIFLLINFTVITFFYKIVYKLSNFIKFL